MSDFVWLIGQAILIVSNHITKKVSVGEYDVMSRARSRSPWPVKVEGLVASASDSLSYLWLVASESDSPSYLGLVASESDSPSYLWLVVSESDSPSYLWLVVSKSDSPSYLWLVSESDSPSYLWLVASESDMPSYLWFLQFALLFDSGEDFWHVCLQDHSSHHQLRQNVVNLSQNENGIYIKKNKVCILSLSLSISLSLSLTLSTWNMRSNSQTFSKHLSSVSTKT